jgi:aryl-alcohol dehydrogenase-like predicted oxidoreductase
MALAPWRVLAAGKIRTDEEEEKRRETGENGRQIHGPWERNEKEKKVCKALEKVAAEIGAKHITSGARFIPPCLASLLADDGRGGW